MSNASSKKVGATEQPANTPKAVVSWSPWLAVVLVVAVYFISQIISQILVLIYPLIRQWSGVQSEVWLTTSITAQFFYVLFAEALTVGLILGFVRWRKTSFKVLGLKKPRWVDPLWGLVALPVYYVAFLAVLLITAAIFRGLNVSQQQQIGFTGAHGSLELALTFFSLVVFPPIAEEILMRGFLYTSLKKAMSTVGAALVTSVIFAIGHLQIGSGAPLLWVAAIFTFVLSLVLVFLREKTGRLYAGMTLHALVNFVSFYQIFIRHVT